MARPCQVPGARSLPTLPLYSLSLAWTLPSLPKRYCHCHSVSTLPAKADPSKCMGECEQHCYLRQLPSVSSACLWQAISVSVYQKVEAVFPGFHRRVFSSSLQDMQLYQLENGDSFLSLCPLPAHARGRRTLARACVRELSAPMALRRFSPPPSQSRVRCGAPRRRNGSPPACRLPKTRQRLGTESPGSTSRRICL